MNKYNPDLHHRHSVRLKYYDYSQSGFYFVTTNAVGANNDNRAGKPRPYKPILGNMVAYFKYQTAKQQVLPKKRNYKENI